MVGCAHHRRSDTTLQRIHPQNPNSVEVNFQSESTLTVLMGDPIFTV